jgi:dihydroneopterin triphosphate diphosphatase
MTTPWRIPESALIVIYNQFGQVLVLQRNDDPSFWQSVTGTREKGETPVQTALREVKEETDIDIIASGYHLFDCELTNQYEIRACWRHRYPPDVKINTEHVFSLQVRADQAITLTEHSDYAWLPKHQALYKVWSPTNKTAIEQFVPNVIVPDGMTQQ